MEMVFFSTLFSTISVFILRIFVDVKMSAVPMMWIVGVFSGGLFFIDHGESPVGLTLGMMLTLLVLIFYMIGPLYREVRLKISNQGLNAIFSLVVALLIVVILYGSMPFCVELDNLKDTDAPIHQPAAMLVAAD